MGEIQKNRTTMICGAAIGSIAGFRMHHKTQSQYQEIIDAIEDITAEE